MAFEQANHGTFSNPGTPEGGGEGAGGEQGFQGCFADGLNQS